MLASPIHHHHRAEAGRAESDRSDDPLNPARGAVLGCALGAGLWIGILALALA